MVEQGYPPGSCFIITPDGRRRHACRAALDQRDGEWLRVVASAHLSRPEDYYSIYFSGCNHDCLKCHSWHFTQRLEGFWASTGDLAEMASDYEVSVTVWEPRERATMWHATELCYHCGECATNGKRGRLCPGKLRPEQVVLSPQGWGPARNIISFTGGDLGCQAGFYAQAAEKIKSACSEEMWVLFETNGYGLTPHNLDVLASGGVDSFWLDIKAFDGDTYRRLCGTTNEWILKTPEWILDRGFTLEVLSLHIPGWVETEELAKIAELISNVDPYIPFTLLAFFPAYKLEGAREPTMLEMIRSFLAVREAGLKRVKLGNCHVFAKSEGEVDQLITILGKQSIG